jgi:hypothetical protein
MIKSIFHHFLPNKLTSQFLQFLNLIKEIFLQTVPKMNGVELVFSEREHSIFKPENDIQRIKPVMVRS